MTRMETIKNLVSGQWSVVRCPSNLNSEVDLNSTCNGQRTTDYGRRAERGFSLISILAIMTIFAIALLAVAPAVVQDVRREKELESIRRGEDVA